VLSGETGFCAHTLANLPYCFSVFRLSGTEPPAARTNPCRDETRSDQNPGDTTDRCKSKHCQGPALWIDLSTQYGSSMPEPLQLYPSSWADDGWRMTDQSLKAVAYSTNEPARSVSMWPFRNSSPVSSILFLRGGGDSYFLNRLCPILLIL